MELRFSVAAQVELDEAFTYLEAEQAGLGYRFTADIDEALGRIRMHPQAWHPPGRNLRRCHLKHFRYGVIYASWVTRRKLSPLRMTADVSAIGVTDWLQSESESYARNLP